MTHWRRSKQSTSPFPTKSARIDREAAGSGGVEPYLWIMLWIMAVVALVVLFGLLA